MRSFGGTTLLRRHKYAALLAILLGWLVLQSFAITTGSRSSSIGHDATTMVLGVAIFLVVFERSALRRIMAVVLILNILTAWARHLPGSSYRYALSMTQSVASAIFFWIAVWAILRNLFRTSVVGSDNVLGAISGYLIAGQGWAFFNSIAYLLAPGTYLFDPKVAPLLADWHGRVALFGYYSYTQMLTIGYGACYRWQLRRQR